jgi:adenine-specific DNA-methyltransferase
VSGPVVRTLDGARLEDLSRDELIERLEALGEGGIRIDFSGKANARELARRVRPRVARPIKKYSAGSEEEQARNLVVEGDNLQAMATLFRERGQVDLILTDPPYNTGNDWRYNDRWEDDPNDPGLGDWVSGDDGARHTKWMRFMWPRLQMMKSMLKPGGGVLAICIDHRELFRLGQMLDELFGYDNRIGIINWQKNYTSRNDNQHISTATEYILIYARDVDRAKTNLLPRSDEANARYTNPDGDPKGPWASNAPHAPSADTHAGMVYAIQSPFTGKLHYPPERRCWAVERATLKSWLEDWGNKYVLVELDDGRAKALLLKGSPDPRTVDDPSTLDAVAAARARAAARLDAGALPTLFFTKNGQGGPRRKTYLEEVRKGVVPLSYWADEDFDEPLAVGATSWDHEQSGHNQTGIHELDAVVGPGHGFQTVKPLKLFRKVIQLWCAPDGLVLDPFAGSGTTGHAALLANAETGASRRFILIEQGRPEKGDSYARSLLADRLARIVSGDWHNGKGKALGGGHRFVTLGKKVDANALLSMEREDLADTIIASHFDATAGRRDVLVNVPPDAGYKYLVAHNAQSEGFFLIWNGTKGNTDFTEETYEACAQEAKLAGLGARYHVYARLYRFQTSNVLFYQIPDRILMDFGLDLRGEPYHDDDES